jgi:hypothetical protein
MTTPSLTVTPSSVNFNLYKMDKFIRDVIVMCVLCVALGCFVGFVFYEYI